MTTQTTERITAAPLARTDLALLLLRAATGVVFLMHGLQKFFTFTIAGTTQAFGGMGVPVPGLTAPLVAGTELIGGALLILGLFARPAAVALAAVIGGALVLVHLKAGFFNPQGIEFPLMLLAASVALALTGPGRYSLRRD